VTPVRQTLSTFHEGKTFFGLIAAIILLALGASALAGERQPQPAGAAQAAATTPGGDKAKQIAVEIQKVGLELAPLFASPEDLFEPAKRQAAAPKAVPALRRMVKLLDDLIASRPSNAPQGQERTQLMALLSALGDKDASAKLAAMASSPVAGEAAAGRSAQLFAAWLLTDGNSAAQQKVVDDLAALAKKYPNEPTVAGAAIMLAGTTALDAQETRQKVLAIVTGTLKSPAAAVAAKQIEATSAKFDARRKLLALEGKPLAFQGATPNGTVLSSDTYKGKVVLVNFWATWCGPCKEELPKLKKLYAQYHAQGLEIVGVSCDNDGQALVKFMGQNRDMTWPQLFDASQPGWHALANQYGINQIPAMFLIDRKGVLRSAEAHDKLDKLIPELIKEQ
jgi:thiol-disulfide isomerase/thioredoxin